MRKMIMPLLATAMGLAAVSSLQAQTPQRTKGDRANMTTQRSAGSHTNGPNAAFKNQQRKFTDPLNANGK